MINAPARKGFAAANGWKVGKLFGLDQLIRRKRTTTRSNDWRSPGTYEHAADHPEYFWQDGYPVALLSHSYPGTSGGYIDGVKAMVARLDGQIVLHIPAAGTAASWYYPGGTLPMLLTRPHATEIVWPTEAEMASYAVAYADELERRKYDNSKRDYLIACARART